MLRAVLFDLDNTLINTTEADNTAYASVQKLLERKVSDPSEVTNLFTTLLAAEPVDLNCTKNVDEWRTILWARSLEQAMTDESLCKEAYSVWKKTRLANMVFNVETVDLLHAVRSQYKIVLLTNGDSQVQWEKIRQCDAEKLFDAVVVSGDTEWEKPDSRIFSFACQLVGLQCENAVMIGDNLNTDIQGAINANLLSSIWFQPSGDGYAAGTEPQAEYSVARLAQLPGILKQIELKANKRTD
ncbi:N-acylneuraminate-9-phosphatase-like [Corticium candelabrum]|uniref:N-acylneuraminate-9-phosphatase-like n=1 Tax=Corticium candelabrum TaxID=121492 RepID=UPI002E275ED4|nr:N-acylneuraminate-9-phosphatase-like [Corticium candelabrum]